MTFAAPDTAQPVSTGLTGLDYVLRGGYTSSQTHLIEGLPGVGKTTLALQFLVEGRERGESGLFVCISETRAEINAIADSHGMTLDGIEIFELLAADPDRKPDLDQSIVHTADLELGETIGLVMDHVVRARPRRLVVGSFSEIRLLAEEPLPYRRHVRALLLFFQSQSCTVLLLENLSTGADIHLQSLASCVIRLEQVPISYGGERRRLRISKMRGRAFRGGYHDFVIRKGGLIVFPRLVTTDHLPTTVREAPVTSGIAGLDAMLGGGIDLGTTTLIRGPSGAGKSALALQPLNAALLRGEKALFISFDETLTNFVRRSHALGMPTSHSLDSGTLRFMRVDPAELSPGEFADTIRGDILGGISAIVIDSLSGYQHAMPAENNLLLHLHELLTFLNQQGALTVLVLADGATEGTFGSPLYLTYLADTVVLIHVIDTADGQKRIVSVAKKRTGNHEPGARELSFDDTGIRVGPILQGLADFVSVRSIDPGGDTMVEALASRRL